MAEGSDEGHKHPVSPAVTENDLGVEWIFGFYSTSAFEWYQFLWDTYKRYWENSDHFFSTETSIERPHEFAYARMSHDHVQSPLRNTVGVHGDGESLCHPLLCFSAHAQTRAYGSLVVCLSVCLSVCLLLVYLFPWGNSSPSICFYVLNIILSCI